MHLEHFCQAILHDQVKHRKPRTKHGDVYVVAHASIRRHSVLACHTHRHLCLRGFSLALNVFESINDCAVGSLRRMEASTWGCVHPVRPSPSVRPTTSQKDPWTTRLLFGSVACFEPRPRGWASFMPFGVLANVCAPSSESTLPSPSHPVPPL